MSEEDIKFPDVNYGAANKKKYEELKISDWSPFFGKDYWEIFIFSMGYAYARGLKPKKVPGTGTMPARVFLPETRHLMRSLAIDHAKKVGKPDPAISVIKNPKSYVKICEEYAAVGFPEVYKILEKGAGDAKPTENLLAEIIKDVWKERD